jgi:hypothetical protein
MPSALVIWLAIVALPVSADAAARTAAVSSTEATCSIDTLPGLSAQLRRVSRETGRDPTTATPYDTSPAQAGRIADFWQIAFTVLGVSEDPRERDDKSVGESVGLPSLTQLPCGAAVRARDHITWSMGLVGYSAREIADVLNGHLTRADLDEALSRTMAGEPKATVAAFLDSRWREPAKALAAQSPPATVSHDVGGSAFEDEIVALAQAHRVEPALVRAIIAVESGGNARAVSSAGAIGLMQLMPRTAAALGVNPWQPLENLRGGIAYLAGLLRAYGEDVRLALIAYNAGPQHADLVRSGRAVAYRETRKYVEAIAARYPF